MIGELVSFYFIAAIYLTTFVVFFGICVYLVAIFHDFNANVEELEQKIIKYTKCDGTAALHTLYEVQKTIHELLQFHSEIYMYVTFSHSAKSN